MTAALVGPSWLPLLQVSARSLAWRSLLSTSAVALGAVGLLLVLPAQADVLLPQVSVLVLACSLAAVVDDDAADVTATAPVPVRNRLAARALFAVPVSALALGAVFVVAAAADAGPGAGLVTLWAVLGTIALAVAAVAARGPLDLPGPAVAAVVLGAGLILLPLLPASVLIVGAWDTTTERVLLTLVLAAGALAWATRDPAA